MQKFYSKKIAISGRLGDIRKRIIALNALDKKIVKTKKAAIKSELTSILEAHKKDVDFMAENRHLYSKILRLIVTNLFLLEEAK